MSSPRVWRRGLSELWQLGGQGGSQLGGSHGLCPLWRAVGAGRSPVFLKEGEEAMGSGVAAAVAALVAVAGLGGDLGSPGRPGSQARLQGWTALQSRWARHVTIR